eukprot:TRINITY_DN103933_c0_g1_i1.p1 TRINITY_DN103933_c0_g1~~TRINITY_DN103933_c0_g1_i1.p1  ORF type:complete len:120 (-),score=22.20 TRINITY_DN103933_c0_g1_i1:251-610(-)
MVLRFKEKDALWRRIMASEHGVDEKNWVPKNSLTIVSSYEKDPSQKGEDFSKGLVLKLGRVDVSLFGWKMGYDRVLRVLFFLGLFQVASNKDSTVKECCVGVGVNVSWIVWFRRALQWS